MERTHYGIDQAYKSKQAKELVASKKM